MTKPSHDPLQKWPRVFISYAREDGEAFVTKLRKRLERQEPEITLWQDRAEMKGGVGWRVQIEQALDKVMFTVMVMTPAALRSEVCHWEWRYARQRGVVVCPVMTDLSVTKTPGFEALPQWMRKAHWYNLEHEWKTFCRYLKSPPQVRRVPFMAPDLPAHFVARPLEFDRLIDLLLDRGTGDPVAISTTLHGAGGYGKTTLAAALCRDGRVIEAYDDGILWATLGQTPNLLGELGKLYEACSGERPEFADVGEASRKLAEKLDSRNCLLMIDDVWQSAHLEPFLRGGKTICARLITTRIPSVVESDQRVEVDAMQGEESIALLASRLQKWPDQVEAHRAEFTTLASRLLDWPLLLKLASGQLHARVEYNEPLAKALNYVQRALVKRGLTAFDCDNPHHRGEAVQATLGASLAELKKPDQIERLQDLAIFPEDIDIPLKVVERYWSLDELDTEDLATRLDRLSLIDLDLGKATLKVHDEVRLYLDRKLADHAVRHARLVDRLPDPHSVEGASYDEASRYALAWGVYHLLYADRVDAVRERLFDFHWLSAKLARLGSQAVLEDFEQLPSTLAEERALHLLHRTLQMTAHILARSPEQLAPQLLGRLPEALGLEIAALRQTARNWRGRTWLCPLQVQMQPPGALLRVLEGHEHWVNSVAFSPDGTRIASGSYDKTLRLWDAESGEPIGKPLQGHRDSVTSVAFSPDGTRIASGSSDKTLRLWDANSGEPIGKPLQGHRDSVTSVAFSPDGTHIVSGGSDKTLRLWDTNSGEPIGKPLQGHENSVTSVAFSSSDGSRIVSGSWDKTLRLWDANSGEPIGKPLQGHEKGVRSVAFSPDGTRIVSGSLDKTLRLWDANSGEPIGKPLQEHDDSVNSVAFSSPDGTRIVSGSRDKTLRLWDATSGEPIGAPLQGHEDWVNSMAFSPDGTRIVSGGSDKTLRLWDATSGEQHIGKLLERHRDWVISVAFSPDANRIVSGSWDKTLRLWDATSGMPTSAPLEGHEDPVRSVAFSPDGTRIVSGSSDKTLRLWDATSGKQIGAPLKGHESWVIGVAFSPDGTRIVSGSSDKTLRLWDATSGKQIGAPLHGHKSSVNSVGFSPDGTHIVSGSRDKTLRLWDATSGEQIGAPLRGHEHFVNSIAFSPDGTRIVSGSSDKALRLWDAMSGKPIGDPLQGHEKGVRSVAVSPDGTRIVSGSYDKTLRLWDATSGELLSLLELDSSVLAVGWYADNVAAGESRGAVQVFRVIEPGSPAYQPQSDSPPLPFSSLV